MDKNINPDLTEVLKKYAEIWVALNKSLSKVISSGKTPQKALKKAQKEGYSDPYILWAANNYGANVPNYR